MITPGVLSVVGFGNEPAPITDREVDSIRAILKSGFAAEPCPYLRAGQRVRVQHGALTGVEGLLVQKKSEWRMVVSIELLQRAVSVEIDRENITAA